MAVNDLITFRKGTASAWTSANPVLASGEPGYDLTNGVLKIGDGVSNWVALSGIGSTSVGGSSSSYVGVRGIISTTGTLTSFAVSGGYPVGYLDLFQDGVKLVSTLDFSATDGSNVTLNNSVPSGTVLEYLTMASGVSSGGGALSGSVTIPQLGDYAFSSVSLLLHMNGSGNTFTDSSATPKAIMAFGNVTQSTEQSKFGGKAAYFDGTGDYIQLSTQNQSSLQFSTQQHTVEFWFKTAIMQQYTCLFYRGQQSEAAYDYVLNINNASASAGDLALYSLGFGGAMTTTSGGWNDNVWHHVAIVRDAGNVFRMYVDGVQQATRTYDMTQSYSNSSDSIIRIGKDGALSGRDYSGYIDELRISTVCRYPSGTSFVPSAIAFSDAAEATFPVTITGSGGGSSSYDSRWDLFLPPAPTGLTAAVGNAQATLSWTAPTVLAQTPITDYVVQHSSNSGSTWTTFSDGTSTSTSATVTGLTNGTAYVFRVAATNDIGTGSYSAASSAVTPNSASVPDAPTSLRNADNYWGCSSNDTMWNAPVSNGGSAITGYVWRIGSGATTSVAPSSGTRPAGSYTGGFIDNHAPTGSFQVAAVNAVGTGPFASITLQQDCN